MHRELEPLERAAFVGSQRLLEHAVVELEPRQLAVQEQLGLLALAALRRRRLQARPPRLAEADLAAEHVGQQVGARERGQPLHGEVAAAVDLEHPAARPRAARFTSLHLLQVVGVERVGEAQDRGQLVHEHARVAVERHVGQVRLLGQRAPVVAGDVRDDRHVVAARGRRSPRPTGCTARACGGRAGSRRCRCRAAAPRPPAAAGRASASPCSARSSSNRRTASAATCLACARVVAVLLAERRRARPAPGAQKSSMPCALVAERSMSSSSPARSDASGTSTVSAAVSSSSSR